MNDLFEQQEKNKPAYTALGLTEKDLEALYLTVKNLYQQKKYREAIALFRLLALYNHQDKRPFIGLGSCFEKSSDYTSAILSYKTAALLDPQDPLPPFLIANCWLTEKKSSEALEALEQSILLSEKEECYARLHQDALKMKQALLLVEEE